MTALNLIMTIKNICDGDIKNPNLRHTYTIKDMRDMHTLSKYGDKGVANITLFDLKTGKKVYDR